MYPRTVMRNVVHWLRPLLLLLALFLMAQPSIRAASPGAANRLTYLDEPFAPFYPSQTFPKLTTPQWIGEEDVELVVTYGIDDMSGLPAYERYLRPILERLKRIDGRAPVSIFSNAPRPEDPLLQQWLKEGLTFEVHTLSHPCPILAQHSFTNAANTFHGCVDLLNTIPGNAPIAFRTPCCDSINSASPRVFAELLARTNARGQFLRMDSSVAMVFTTNDTSLPANRLLQTDGRERFRKYVPFPAFTTTIENYPYPYIHTGFLWEMPFVTPSDWQSQNVQGNASPTLLDDWKTALDLIALKQGTFNFVFHPALWSSPTQHVAFIDYAVENYGKKVKFLNYRETHDRLTQNLLDGQPLRAADGSDNGVRLLDLNQDGYLDVVIGNDAKQETRLWDPAHRRWINLGFPTRLSTRQRAGSRGQEQTGARFGTLEGGAVILLVRNDHESGAWRFAPSGWVSAPDLLRGLELDGQPVATSQQGLDRGCRLRDVDGDGDCELLVANESQNAVFAWNATTRSWTRKTYRLPGGASIVNARGEDNGLRFVDLNGDGAEDVIFSNEESYLIALMVPKPVLGFQTGWTRDVIHGSRGQLPEIPRIVRSGPARNNGVWFAKEAMWAQNEDTAHMPNIVQHHSFAELLSGFQPPALSPDQSLAAIQVPTNFTVALVAAEPTVTDPVFIDWGEDGRMWVVEMHDYPFAVDGKPGGVVKRLEDVDGDGYYEKATVFAENLSFPNGLLPWGKGVLISASPDILYAEDTDGDGHADRIEKLFSGFRVWNQQHLLNGFDYGLDNWVYGANGDSGGTAVSAKTGAKVNISGRDFRFQPGTGAFETIAGQTQFGRHRDDWGNWFGNANPIWLWHYWIPEHYVKRNPKLAVDPMRRETATYPDAGRVFPRGRKQQRMNDVGTVGNVTSANSPTPYRDTLFGEAFSNAVFVSEPVHNLIRCEILHPEGASFSSTRWNAEQPTEFFSSTDTWSRPTGLKTGPDGALYVADMYRQYIEHPEWIPDDIKRKVNLRAGEERGRIYRIYPKGVKLRPPPRLDHLHGADLAGAIDHPNGWQRDTVQRLIVTRRDTAAITNLRRLAVNASLPKVRLQSLCTLDGLDGLESGVLESALKDAHSGVREQAVRLCEQALHEGAPRLTKALTLALAARLQDESLRVRYQLALTLGEWDTSQSALLLAQLAIRDAAHPDIVTAVMSSAARRPAEIFQALTEAGVDLSPLERLTRHLVELAVGTGNAAALSQVMASLKTSTVKAVSYASWQLSAFAQLLQQLEKTGPSSPELREALAALPPLLLSARALAVDEQADLPRRMAALSLLGRDSKGAAEDTASLAALLRSQTPPTLRSAALTRLAQLRNDSVSFEILQGWSGLAPSAREPALELLLRRPTWTRALLDKVESRTVSASDLPASVRQRLLSQSDASLQQRARALLARVENPQRGEIITRYLPEVRRAQANPAHGSALFTQHCGVCHRMHGEGQGAAPDLASVVDRSPERMLIAILDPNRAVEDRYLNYIAKTRAGDELSGILAGESANSITLASPAGIRETLLRSDLESLTSTRLSLMPEGFDQVLKPQDIADILAHLDANASVPRRFQGNSPAVVRPATDGALRLLASIAEVHGDGIAFETQYNNLGSWNGVDARAVWTLDVAEEATYEVWLQWACPETEAGDRFRFQIAEQTVSELVPGTKNWDSYEARAFGKLRLSAGRQKAVFQADPSLKSYLIDLLEIRLVRIGNAPAPAFSPAGAVRSAAAK